MTKSRGNWCELNGYDRYSLATFNFLNFIFLHSEATHFVKYYFRQQKGADTTAPVCRMLY